VNVGEALYLGIVDNQYRPDSESTDPRTIIAAAEAVYPSQRAAARAAGVGHSTWQGWQKGRRPRPAGFARLQALQRRLRLPKERERWMREGHIVVRGWILFSGKGERFNRLVTDWPSIPKAPRSVQPPGMQGRILDAWLSANDVAAVNTLMGVLVAAMSEYVGKEIEVQIADIDSIRWYETRGEAMYAMRQREF
jgi:hypothetical protein